MKEVDQDTGEDLNPASPAVSNANTCSINRESAWMNPENDLNNSENTSSLYSSTKRTRPRLSTPERWELRQMMCGGALSNFDLPDFDPEIGVLKNFDGKINCYCLQSSLFF